MHLRRARPEDYEAIGAMTVAAYQPQLTDASSSYAEHLANAEARDRQAELWVAVGSDDHEVLGTVTICREGSPWREVAAADEGEFRMLAVAPQAQGQGVGEALVRHVVDRFREEGATAVVMSTNAHGTAPAQRLYQRLGFVRCPERDWSPMPGVELIVYRLDLA
ncbi:MAG TPA: GNAT family N-acetyltransferase [Nocardioides sp.]|uniref:GNAT family N-acetyltransferase n=1 Tax=Nocardioides sp. TaxID=35761 RepID=UPI002E333D34|nr:GNAT family N-acetyltransferase [Nocardioides sp.]HEX5089071.1 GNAT family N-acetyltransferase [Nocardioides sp.]